MKHLQPITIKKNSPAESSVCQGKGHGQSHKQSLSTVLVNMYMYILSNRTTVALCLNFIVCSFECKRPSQQLLSC